MAASQRTRACLRDVRGSIDGTSRDRRRTARRMVATPISQVWSHADASGCPDRGRCGWDRTRDARHGQSQGLPDGCPRRGTGPPASDPTASLGMARGDSVEELFERARRTIPGGVNSPVRAFGAVGGTPRFAVRGEGAYVSTPTATGTSTSCSRGAHCCSATRPGDRRGGPRRGGARDHGAPTELEVELAERITAAMPSVEMVRLVSSGTEAAMSAIRLARGFTGRDLVVKFEAATTGTRTRCSRRVPGAAWRRSGSPARPG